MGCDEGEPSRDPGSLFCSEATFCIGAQGCPRDIAEVWSELLVTTRTHSAELASLWLRSWKPAGGGIWASRRGQRGCSPEVQRAETGTITYPRDSAPGCPKAVGHLQLVLTWGRLTVAIGWFISHRCGLPLPCGCQSRTPASTPDLGGPGTLEEVATRRG